MMVLSYQEWKLHHLDELSEKFHDLYGAQVQESADFMEHEYAKYVASFAPASLDE